MFAAELVRSLYAGLAARTTWTGARLLVGVLGGSGRKEERLAE